MPPADHLLIERDRGQFVPSRRRHMMANVRAECLLKIPAEPGPELRIPGAAGQTRIVSKARIGLDSRKSVRSFKKIICVDISEFESSHPSHAVTSPRDRVGSERPAGDEINGRTSYGPLRLWNGFIRASSWRTRTAVFCLRERRSSRPFLGVLRARGSRPCRSSVDGASADRNADTFPSPS